MFHEKYEGLGVCLAILSMFRPTCQRRTALGSGVGTIHSPNKKKKKKKKKKSIRYGPGHFYCTQHLLGECPSRSPAA